MAVQDILTRKAPRTDRTGEWLRTGICQVSRTPILYSHEHTNSFMPLAQLALLIRTVIERYLEVLALGIALRAETTLQVELLARPSHGEWRTERE